MQVSVNPFPLKTDNNDEYVHFDLNRQHNGLTKIQINELPVQNINYRVTIQKRKVLTPQIYFAAR